LTSAQRPLPAAPPPEDDGDEACSSGARAACADASSVPAEKRGFVSSMAEGIDDVDVDAEDDDEEKGATRKGDRIVAGRVM